MAAQTSLFGDVWKKLCEAKEAECFQLPVQLEAALGKLEAASATHASLLAASTEAEAALRVKAAAADKEAATARALFESLRKHHLVCRGANMEYEHGVELERRAEELEKQASRLRDEKRKLQDEHDERLKELKNATRRADDLHKDNNRLATALKAEKAAREQKAADADDIQQNLDTAYADLQRKEVECRTLRKQRDDKEAELKAATLQLQDAHDHFQVSQERVDELEGQQSAIAQLEQDNATLQAEMDTMQQTFNDHDRTIQVKDARIAHLEIQYQKALEGKLAAELRADAAAEPVAQHSSTVDTNFGASLADELADEFEHLSNRSDSSNSSFRGEIYQTDVHADGELAPDADAQDELQPSLELCAVTTIATTSPRNSTRAPMTTAATQTSPEQKVAVTTSTQTEPTKADLTVFVETAVQTIPVEPQQPEHRIFTSTAAQIAPVEPQQPEFGTAFSTAAQTAPVEAQKPNLNIVRSTAAHISAVDAEQPNLGKSISTAADTAPVESQDDPIVSQGTLSESDLQSLWETAMEPAIRNLFASASSPNVTLNYIASRVQDMMEPMRTAQSETSCILTADQNTQTALSPVVRETPSTPAAMTDQDTQTDLPSPSPPVVLVQNQRSYFSYLGLPNVFGIFFGNNTPAGLPPSSPPVVVVEKKRSYFSLSTAFAIFFAMLSLLYYVEMEYWRTTNQRLGINRLYNSGGYQRRGRHLFGAIPLCYEQGETWLIEAFCQQFTNGVQALEAWAGIEYPPRW